MYNSNNWKELAIYVTLKELKSRQKRDAKQ